MSRRVAAGGLLVLLLLDLSALLTDRRDLVDAASFVAFFVLLVLGAATTAIRVAYYQAHGAERPRLLSRDAIVTGGLAITIGVILGVRSAVSANLLDASTLRDSVAYALASNNPGLIAVAVYAYFELFVIRLGDDRARDYPLDRLASEVPHMRIDDDDGEAA